MSLCKLLMIEMKMKKKLLLMMGLFITLGTQAQINEKVYFTAEQMPDMMVFMPGPPDSTSTAFAYDVSRYYWGKEMRKDSVRAAEAKRDAVYGLETILTEFKEAFGMEITKEGTPKSIRFWRWVRRPAVRCVPCLRVSICAGVRSWCSTRKRSILRMNLP